jgi:hypothetical protein
MENNKICKYCEKILDIIMFRYNRLKCKDCEKEYSKNYRRSDIGKEKSIQWNNQNQNRYKQLQSDWYQNNKEHIRNKFNDRYKNDHEFRIRKNCQRRIQALFKENKQYSTNKYLNCTNKFFIEWLEFCFRKDNKMNLDNHGSYWHLDHVIPITKFDLTKEDQIYLCFNWINYMPLSAKENISKQNKILSLQIAEHIDNILDFHIKNEIKINKEYFQLLARHLTMRETP